MKINLDKLKEMGWDFTLTEGRMGFETLELNPPPMDEAGHKVLQNLIQGRVVTPMGKDVVTGAFYDALGKAALLEAME